MVRAKTHPLRLHFIALIALAGGLAFWPSLGGQLTNWDDEAYITNNALIRPFTPGKVAEIFTTPHYLGNYHPLTLLSYAAEYHFVGEKPWLYHFDNLLLHVLNSVLVFFLVLQLSANAEASLIAALLFAVHPLRVESVAWVSERKDVLYSAFFLGASLCYLKFRKKQNALKFYTLSFALFFLSLLSKGAAVPLPLTFLLFDFLQKRKWDKWVLLEKIPFFLTSLGFGILVVYAQNLSGSVSSSAMSTMPERLLNACFGLSIYLDKTLVPLNLSAMYPYPTQYFWTDTAFITLVFAGALATYRSTRKTVFGFAYFLVSISLFLQILGVGKMVAAERLTYIPLLGLFYLAGEGFVAVKHWAEKQKNHRLVQAIHLSAFTIFLILIGLTRDRCLVWQDTTTLMNDVIAKQPRAADAYINRALASKPAQAEQAIADYTKAIELAPWQVVSYNNRGLIYWNRGDAQKALADYDRGLQIDPGYTNLYFNRLLVYYYSLKDYTRARADYERARQLGFPVNPAQFKELQIQ